MYIGDQLTGSRNEYAYHGQGKKTLIRDPLDRETTFTLDDLGRQLTRPRTRIGTGGGLQ